MTTKDNESVAIMLGWKFTPDAEVARDCCTDSYWESPTGEKRMDLPNFLEQINIATAEDLGWKPPVPDPNPWWAKYDDAEIRCKYCGCHCCDCSKEIQPPNFCGDLNACATFEEPLGKYSPLWHRYLNALGEVCSPKASSKKSKNRHAIMATALQRAIAYCKTKRLGPWKE